MTAEPVRTANTIRGLSRLADGRVMCCICFEYRERFELADVDDEPGKKWDLCRTCAPAAGHELRRPSFDDYFMAGAKWIATRSDCRRRQQGTLIVKDHRVIATGYIGVGPGQDGCLAGACPRGLLSLEELAAYTNYDEGPGFCISTHSEANALIHGEFAQMSGAEMFTWPGAPCHGCRKLIRAARIVRVVWPDGELVP